MASTATFGAAVEAALEVDGGGARGDVAEPLAEDGVRQERGGRGPVAHRLAGLLRRLAEHLDAHVLLGVLQAHLLGDGHAIVAHQRLAPLPFDQDALGLGAEGDADRVGQRGRAPQDLLAGGRTEEQLLGGHTLTPGRRLEDGPHRGADPVGLGQRRVLQMLGIGNGDLGGAHPRHRGIEIEERGLGDPAADLRGQAAGAPGLVDHDRAMAPADGGQDRGIVQRPQTPEIEHFGLHALARRAAPRPRGPSPPSRRRRSG